MPPHAWDDVAHRTAIHTAFDIWFVCHEQGNRRQAKRWLRELVRLTVSARARFERMTQRASVVAVMMEV